MDQQTKAVIISPEVFEKLPGLVFISGFAKVDQSKIRNLDNIKNYLEQSWQGLQQKVSDPNSEESKRIQLWTETLKASGVKVKDFPPSIQAIAKRATKGGPAFSINPVVDVYNAISMELALPLGAYDTAVLKGELLLRLSAGGEPFIGLGSSESDPTIPGEIVFSDNEEILTRMFLWRQSHNAKITNDTTKFIFVSELLNDMGSDIVERAKNLIVEKMQSLLGAEISNLTVQVNNK